MPLLSEALPVRQYAKVGHKRLIGLSDRRICVTGRVYMRLSSVTGSKGSILYDEAEIYRDLAPLLRVRPEFQQLCTFGGPSQSVEEAGQKRWAPIHIVTGGPCLLDAGPRTGIRLNAGDIAVLPHGGPHRFRPIGDQTAIIDPVHVRRRLHDELSIASDVPGMPDTRLICGRCCFENADDNIVLAAMPAVIVLVSGSVGGGDRLRAIAVAICAELEDDRLGSAIVAASLASTLMLMVLRAHFEEAPPMTGIFALLARPQTARVLAAILASPEQGWTLDELAAIAATSRATLVRQFQRAVGVPPLAYLSELRLGMARQQIVASSTALVVIAEDVGYQSESAFSRAYHRRFGVAPGAHRSDAQRSMGV